MVWFHIIAVSGLFLSIPVHAVAAFKYEPHYFEKG